VVARTRAGDVEQVASGVIDLLQVGIVSGRFDALVQGDDFIVAGQNDPKNGS
jgi:hypothetical protein